MIGRRGFIFRALGLVAAALMPWRAPAAEPERLTLAQQANFSIDCAPLVYNQELYGPVINEVPEGHTAVVRTGLPRAEWRKLNDPRKRTVQVAPGKTVRFGMPPASLKEMKREWREVDRMTATAVQEAQEQMGKEMQEAVDQYWAATAKRVDGFKT